MPLHIPAPWEELDPARVRGTVVVLGATDVGKSTFVSWWCRRVIEHHPRVSWLDADIGQTSLGPPTTMTLAILDAPQAQPRRVASFFVGSPSP